MFLKSKVFNHGNVSAQPVDGVAHKFESYDAVLPSNSTYEVSRKVLDENFKLPQINQQRKVEPFDTTTGIISNSPEIIAFSNFIPAYDRNGDMNDYGNFLEKKQNAHLINITSKVKKSVKSPNFDQYVDIKNIILDYCEQHSKGIDELLLHFSKLRKKLDFRNDIDIDTLRQIGAIPPNSDLNSSSPATYSNFLPLSIEEILHDSLQNISKWTPTKLWLQCCLELKEVLANGMIQTFLSDGNVLSVNSSNESYYDPYTLVAPKTSFIKKFAFSEKQVNVYPISTLTRNDSESIEMVKLVMTNAFSSTSIFNEKVFSDTSNLDESIAKISHTICKEYVYSTQMKADILTDYGYPYNFNGKNINIWNHLIGNVGSDITEILPSPLGGGKSLVSLSQTVEPDATEVLSFEDRYIYDNVGTVRPNAIITPGTFYYLESSINTVNNGFDLTRVNRYLTRLNSATRMLKMVKDDLLFKEESPYSTIQAKVTDSKEKNVDIKNLQSNLTSAKSYSILKNSRLPKQKTVLDSLSSPIKLLRYIEENILNGSGLVRRQPGPKLWTNKNSNDVEKDVSSLLISLAIDKDDPELQALLFLHQIYASTSSTYSGLKFEGFPAINPANATVKGKIIDQIIQRIHKLLSANTVNPRFKLNTEASVSIDAIRDALMSPQDSQSLSILNKIGQLILEFDSNFETNDPASRTNGRFFLDQTRNANSLGQDRALVRQLNIPLDKKSAYSGVQKTLYLSSIFKLCFLMIHAANPERLTNIRKPNNAYDASDKIGIIKVKNAVIGIFLTSDQIKQGLSKFTLLENNVEGYQSISMNEKINLGAQKIIDFDPQVNMYNGVIKKINLKNSRIRSLEKTKISIFELPNSIQGGFKVFDNKNLSKKFNITDKESNSGLVALHYDDIMVKAENLLGSYNSKLSKYIDKFYSFVYSLRSEFLQLKNNLQLKSGQYGRTLTMISRQIANPTLTRAAFSEEQLLLVRNKMQDYVERLKSDYESPLKEVTPYFLNFKEKKIENMVPVEDVHAIAWNLFLKDFLKRGELLGDTGANKKIMSIGIPQKLHRRMRVNSAGLSGLAKRNSIIQLCIYRINTFLPEVIYKPLTFLFDLKLFPTRILGNYKKSGFDISGEGAISVDTNLSDPNIILENVNSNLINSPYQFANTTDVVGFIPHYKSKDEYQFQLITPDEKSYIKSEDYPFLDDKDFVKLFENHSKSFLLEEYLRFVTDLPFDEHRYIKYGELSINTRSNFESRFVGEFELAPIQQRLTQLFNDKAIDVIDPYEEIKNLIMPRKFDRVFNVIMDPDDFEVDESTPQSVLSKYLTGDKTIKDLSVNEPSEPTFDKYYVLVKSFEGSNAS
jgi:hypothetical protein